MNETAAEALLRRFFCAAKGGRREQSRCGSVPHGCEAERSSEPSRVPLKGFGVPIGRFEVDLTM